MNIITNQENDKFFMVTITLKEDWNNKLPTIITKEDKRWNRFRVMGKRIIREHYAYRESYIIEFAEYKFSDRGYCVYKLYFKKGLENDESH